MKIATYNIWNDSAGMPGRKRQIAREIGTLDAEVLVLQEVCDSAFAEKLFQQTGFTHYRFFSHPGEAEGLAIFSRYPLVNAQYAEFALISCVEAAGRTILVANVHLPWNSVLARERRIVSLVAEMSGLAADDRFILGDFNCSEASSVHQYLTGGRSLQGTEAAPYWIDLALVAEEALGVEREMTLDLRGNPRWKGRTITDVSARADCIFLQDGFPSPSPVLMGFRYFGKEIDGESGLCASDHYGVSADLRMP